MYEKITGFTASLLEQSTPQRPIWNQEVLMGHISLKWNYIDGCMLKAILDLHDASGDSVYLEFADRFTDYYVNGDGAILGYSEEDFNCDNINGGKVLLTLHKLTGNEKYRKAADILYGQLMSQPRTESGNFWHKLIYPNQVWLDGLYMTLPFYAEYETGFNKSENIKDIFKQFKNVRDNMRDPKTGLLYHGRDEARLCAWANPETGCSPNFWSRSLGWYSMALLDTAEKIDEQQFLERETLTQYLKEIMDALLAAADSETGMLWQVTDQGGRDGNYLETSSSCAFSYALMKGARLGFLPETYFDAGKRVFDSIMQHKLRETESGIVLGDICLVAGLGVYPGRGDYKERDGTFEYYISEPKVDNDAKGVAPFLMAFSELLRKGNLS